MVFALATDECQLYVFASSGDAIADCEGIDVEDGGWLFWDDEGHALEARFISQNVRGSFVVASGDYYLVPSADHPGLAETISSIRGLSANPYFSSLDELAKTVLRAPADGT